MMRYYKKIYRLLKKFFINRFYFFYCSINILKNIIMVTKTIKSYNREIVFICGDILAYDKGVINYLNNINKIISNHGYCIVLISEADYQCKKECEGRIKFPVINVPQIFIKNYYKAKFVPYIPKFVKRVVSKTDYLEWSVDNLILRHADMSKSYATMFSYFAQLYYLQLIRRCNPVGLIIWNQFHALHNILNNVVKEMGLSVFYMEFGCLPGTFSIESHGQMGESFPATNYKEFLLKPITLDEIDHARSIWKFLKSSKLNRNKQRTEETTKKIIENIDKSRPVVFVAGQNDFESGLCPYTKNTEKKHSPIFKNSDEAISYIADLGKKNQWTVIYKPHPIIRMLASPMALPPENVITIEDIDINEIVDFADVTVTILSQTGYISLIREKPTVMLGYTQLRGKSCTYEAFKKEDIEEQIKEALSSGFTIGQKAAFSVHIAQLIKYYLYDDMLERQVRYGKSVEDAVDFILMKKS